jgi:hypothetical protein
MADIFISYSKEEGEHTRALAAELEASGFSVWWDTSLAPGEAFGRVIREEVEKAKAVIVIWSRDALKSDWVLWEATRAHQRRVLIPLRTEDVEIHEIPPPFSVFQIELVSNRVAISAALAKLGLVRERPGGVRAAALPSKHLVILVHGINTRARWMGFVKPALENAGFAVAATSYGKFGVLRFLSPLRLLRRAAVERVVRDINLALLLYRRKVGEDPARLSVISHSFGTYVITRILTDHPEFKWHRILFCGSVVREDFRIDRVIERFDDPLLNEVGTRDFWPALGESAGWGYGSVGANEFNRPGVVTRWHKDFHHSDFFTAEFCNEYWVPFLKDGTLKLAGAPLPMARWVTMIASLPLRWIILILLISFIIGALVALAHMIGGNDVTCIPIRWFSTDLLYWGC